MDGRRRAEGLARETLAEVQRVYELLRKATEQEHWRLAQLMVSKQDGELFGQTEFQVRDHLLRMGARAMEATVNDRKKGGTKVAPMYAQTVVGMPDSKGGGPRPS